MARRANFGFEKRQKEIKKQQKRDAKAEKKALKKAEAEVDPNATEADLEDTDETGETDVADEE